MWSHYAESHSGVVVRFNTDIENLSQIPGAWVPLEVTYHRVSVEINDQVATTSVDQEFFNPKNITLAMR
jgi:hypothetical protein